MCMHPCAASCRPAVAAAAAAALVAPSAGTGKTSKFPVRLRQWLVGSSLWRALCSAAGAVYLAQCSNVCECVRG